jgi:ubiquitin thioesterase OTU1
MKFRVRLPGDPAPREFEIDGDVELGVLPIALESQFHVLKENQQMAILGGFPPKRLDLADADSVARKLSAVFRNGDMLTVQVEAANATGPVVKRGHTDGKYVPPIDDRNAMLVRHVVPGDNSCLFHSLGWILNEPAAKLRAQVSEGVLGNPDKFTTAFLGSPPRQYAEWILNPDSWGGAIEIQLLSFVFQMELVVLDTTSKRLQQFGQEHGFTTRGFIIYTGNHYDGAGVGSSTGGGSLQRVFGAQDEKPLGLAKRYLQGLVDDKERKPGQI